MKTEKTTKPNKEILNANGLRRSSNYVGSFRTSSDKDARKIKEIKKAVRRMNQYIDVKKRVVIRGRKALMQEVFENSVTGQTYHRNYNGSRNMTGGIKNAKVVDIYIYNR